MTDLYKKYLEEIKKQVREHVSSVIYEKDKAPNKTTAEKTKNFVDKVLKDKGSAILHTFNIKELTPLGSGSHGTAFDCGDGKVLKITNDESEFDNCSQLIGQKIPHVLEVYRVARIKNENVFFIQYKKYELLQDRFPELYSFFLKYAKENREIMETVLGFYKGRKQIPEVSEKEFSQWKAEQNVGTSFQKMESFDDNFDDFDDELEDIPNEDFGVDVGDFIESIRGFLLENKAFKNLKRNQQNYIIYLMYTTGDPDFIDDLMFQDLGSQFMKMMSDIVEGTMLLYKKAGVDFYDYSANNTAVEGDNFLLIDIGHSKNHPKPKSFEIIESRENQF